MSYTLLSSTLLIILGINEFVKQPHIHAVDAFSIVTSIDHCRSSTSIKSNMFPSIDSNIGSSRVNTKNRIRTTNVVSYNKNDFRLFYIDNENRGIDESESILQQQKEKVQETISQDALGPNLPVTSSVSLLSSSTRQNNIKLDSTMKRSSKNDDSVHIAPFFFAVLDILGYCMIGVGATLSFGLLLNVFGYAYWYAPGQGIVIDTLEHIRMSQELFSSSFDIK